MSAQPRYQKFTIMLRITNSLALLSADSRISVESASAIGTKSHVSWIRGNVLTHQSLIKLKFVKNMDATSIPPESVAPLDTLSIYTYNLWDARDKLKDPNLKRTSTFKPMIQRKLVAPLLFSQNQRTISIPNNLKIR